MTNEKEIWLWFKENTGYSNEQIAGIMGNIEAESAGYPNNLQNSYEAAYGNDNSYTKAVQDGSYRYKTYNNARLSFGYDQGGYGLCQWTSYDRKLALYDRTVGMGRPLDDISSQLSFLIHELRGTHANANAALMSAKTVGEASKVILQKFEIPAGYNLQSVISYREKLSQAIYDRCSKLTAPVKTETVKTPGVNSGKVEQLIHLLNQAQEIANDIFKEI